MGMCAGPGDARTFARMLAEVFSSGPDQRVSRWRVELRRYDPVKVSGPFSENGR